MESKGSVLVVDDEPFMRSILQTRFEINSFEVSTAVDGIEAIEFIKEKDFDVVILDIVMPMMNGIEVLKQIKEIKPLTEVIIFTGYADVDTAISAFKSGAYDYLKKGGDSVNKILKAVNKAIELRRNRITRLIDTTLEQPEKQKNHDEIGKNKEIKRLEKNRDILPIIVGGLLHDMMGMLTAIAGYSDLLLLNSNSINSKYLEAIIGCTQKIGYMMETLKKTVRPYYKSETDTAYKSNFEQLTQPFLSYVSSIYPDCKLTFHGLRTIPILIIPIGVSTFIISELVENAITSCRNTQTDFRIDLSFRYDLLNKMLTIVCEDSGHGFQEPLLSRYKTGDFQPPNEGSEKGYGLYMIAEIVGRLNGQITARNQERSGAIVTIFLTAECEDGSV